VEDARAMTLHVVTPSEVFEVGVTGPSEMLLVNEEEPIADVVVTDSEGDADDFEAAPAAFFPRLLAGPSGIGTVGVLWDRASLDENSLATLHAVADLLEDGGATLVGYDDEETDLQAAAQMRTIIGVASVDEPDVQSAISQWLRSQSITSLVIVEPAAAWVVLDVDGAGLRDAIDNAEVVPAPMRPIVPQN